MAYTPHPDKPGELNEIERAMRELRRCERAGGGWDLMALNAWLETYPNAIWNDLQSLDAWLERTFPPVQESVGAAHGNVQPHHYQTA